MVALKLTISAALSLIAGLLILFFPKLIRISLGLYLIIIGLISWIDF